MERNNLPVRILIFGMTPFFGGGEIYCLKLAKLLRERYQVYALTANPDLHAQLQDVGIASFLLPGSPSSPLPVRYMKNAAHLWKVLRKVKPDMVHMNGQAELYFSGIPRLLRVPITTTRHTTWSNNNEISRLKRALVRLMIPSARVVICVSTSLKYQMASFVPESKLVVIPNWIEKMPENRRRPGPPDGICRVLYVGRVLRSKGIFDLIAAFKKISGATLDVVGDGLDLPEAMREAEGYAVRFHGFQRNCEKFYINSDLLVFPGCQEGQGQTPIEAMSYGLPCLASNIEPVIEVSENGLSAEMFQCGSVDDLAGKIEFLRNSPQRLADISKAGLERVRSAYTAQQASKRYFEVFDQVLRGS